MKSNLRQAADNTAGFREKTPEEREKLRWGACQRQIELTDLGST